MVDQVLALVHPFSPFVSEELWAQTAGQAGRETALVSLTDLPPEEWDLDRLVSKVQEFVYLLQDLKPEQLRGLSVEELKAFLQRLDDPKTRDSIQRGIVFNILNDRGGEDLERIQFAKVTWMPELEGKTLAYWCRQRGLEPTPENGALLVMEAQANGGASCVFFAMDESDVQRIMQHPLTMIASDGRLVNPGEGHPHPRWYGTFPRVLGHYVRDLQLLTLEEAIYKMTALPARTLNLEDRGLLKAGMKADITVFNPATVKDLATFEAPHQYPDGIPYVLVNGQLAIDQGRFMDLRAGQVLRKPAGE